MTAYERGKKWALANPEKVRASHRKYAEGHRVKNNARSKARYTREKELLVPMIERARLARKYGISPEDRDAMLNAQGHCCAICNIPLRGRWKSNIDHDHATLAVRGMLCPNCNRGLGMFRDDPVIIHSAARYLFQAKCKKAA